MDDKLKERLIKINDQIEALYKAEEAYLTLDAAKDHTLAVSMASAPPECSSEASKASWAKSLYIYLEFKQNLAHAEAEFHKQRHLLDLKTKAYDAEHLSYKIEHSAIKRGVE